MNNGHSLFVLASLAAFLAVPLISGDVPEQLRGVKRIVFIGDSITQGGDYITDFECWLIANGIKVEVLNLGLGSETASDLAQSENEGHNKKFGFPRPALSERLDRILSSVKPDLLFACYGMNDGGSLPAGDEGLKRFSSAVEQLRTAAAKAGAKRVVICTPPVQDAGPGNPQSAHDKNLENYTSWLISRKSDGWAVVDIHGPMEKALKESRKKNPAFKFANDGVHPGREGHWIMAKEILSQFLGAEIKAGSAEQLFGVAQKGKDVRKLVNERMQLMHSAWMTKIGHKRPGVPGGPGAKPGLPLPEAESKAAEISAKIAEKMSR